MNAPDESEKVVYVCRVVCFECEHAL